MALILQFPKGINPMGPVQSQSVQIAVDRPPIEFRVVTEQSNVHHVFAVFDNSFWWHWRATYSTREEADAHGGGSLPEQNTIFVNLSRNELTVNGANLKLTPVLTSVLAVLVERIGHAITPAAISAIVWNDRVEHQLGPHIWALRQILALTPFEIVNSRARGYALVERKPAKEVLR